jgi:dihydrofolate reductase
MKAIVAVDSNWGIGYKGKLLQRIPEDMKNFKQMTLEKVVIMGRETFESLPGMEPLKDRINIVLSKKASVDSEKVILCRSMEELLEELKKYPDDDIFVIGGESIYRQLLPYCSEAYVTKIDNAYEADKYFVNLDKEQNWELVSEGAGQTHKDIQFKFVKYASKK